MPAPKSPQRLAEWKREVGERFRGRKLSAEHRRKIARAGVGRRHSDATKRKMSENQKGEHNSFWRHKHSPRALLSISKHSKGRKFSTAHRRRLSEALKGRIISPQSREKMRRARLGRFTTAQNPNWHGGKSFEPYSLNWTETLRRSIRERDHYTCQICGAPQGDVVLDVHHVDYNKANCSPDNLISLCHSCHAKTNYNRQHWKRVCRQILPKCQIQ